MKAFIVQVIVPNDWEARDVASACNVGIGRHAETRQKPHIKDNALCWSTGVVASFDLKRQDL